MMTKPPQCDGCPFEGGGFVPPDTHGPRLVAWGEMGGADEERFERGFVGQSGKKLRTAMSRIGLKVWRGYDQPLAEQEEDVEFRNAVLCRHAGNVFPGFDAAQECIRRHYAQLDGGVQDVQRLRDRDTDSEGASQPRRPHIAFGANATEALTGWRLPMLKVRGTLLPTHYPSTGRGRHDESRLPPWILSTIHPAFLIRNASDPNAKAMDHLFPFLCNDIAKAIEAPEPRVPTIHAYMRPNEIYLGWHAYQLANPKPWLSIDIEGSGGKPNIVGVSWNPSEVFVFSWCEEGRKVLEEMMQESLPVFHNAAYDIPELKEAGVKPPKVWIDTIVTAAAVMQVTGMMDLQSQVLTYVKGTIAWKGLIDHEQGPDYNQGKAAYYRKLWETILTRLGRNVPRTGADWYAFYNGLDTGWTLSLALAHKDRLQGQGRWGYYEEFLQPNQAPLVWLGLRGLPTDPARVKVHKTACLRLERMAKGILRPVATGLLEERVAEQQAEVDRLVAERTAENGKKFSKGKELTSVRNKLKTRQSNLRDGFNPDSPPQRTAMLYEYLGLPKVYKRKTKAPTSDEKAVENLLGRLRRGTVKAKNETKEQAFRILHAMKAGKKWPSWRRAFLERPLK